MDIENRECTRAATDGDPVFYDISYLAQFLPDIKAKFIPLVNCRSLVKVTGNYQQVYFGQSQGAWNYVTMYFI